MRGGGDHREHARREHPGREFEAKTVRRLRMPQQEAGAFPVSRSGRTVKTRTVLVAHGSSRYKVRRVADKMLSAVEEVAYYLFVTPIVGVSYVADGDLWSIKSVSLHRGEASATVQRGGEPEVWAPLSQIVREMTAGSRRRRVS